MYFHAVIVCWFAFAIAVLYVNCDSDKMFNLNKHLSNPLVGMQLHSSDKTVEMLMVIAQTYCTRNFSTKMWYNKTFMVRKQTQSIY